MQQETNEVSCSTKTLEKEQNNTTLIENDEKKDHFQPYQFLIPDASIHGEGFFVAALPAQPRAERTHCDIGQQPMWHPDASKIGGLFDRDSVFVKYFKDGSISLIYEQQLRHRGLHGYSLTIVDGQILPSDGIGFVFADRVPCSKNIKRLWSIFVNRTGHIIKRMGSHMERQANPHLPPLQLGNCVAMILDLDKYVASFQTTDSKGKILARAKIDLISFAEKVDASQGYLCAVLTKSGVVLRMKKASVDILDQPDVPYQFEVHSHTKSIHFAGHQTKTMV
ncbi:uncharacterized protein LOC128883436 isoform X2 [Hylaeus volcanicus]|uniref:uncharacterized protein LOC128883436 isoform X2 n=1 Tax=Hylaeus volcanicus TaxID=313075 RepID=UPI0023B79F0F|nr:uncharacterized protein LOC128883436 isoform X2 [Hylaeus volcanicus]